jgi:hypothetical protein
MMPLTPCVPLLALGLLVIAGCSARAGNDSPATHTIEHFAIRDSLDNDWLYLAIDTNLPDWTPITLQVMRSHWRVNDIYSDSSVTYFVAHGVIGEWRYGQTINVADALFWHELAARYPHAENSIERMMGRRVSACLEVMVTLTPSAQDPIGRGAVHLIDAHGQALSGAASLLALNCVRRPLRFFDRYLDDGESH